MTTVQPAPRPTPRPLLPGAPMGGVGRPALARPPGPRIQRLRRRRRLVREELAVVAVLVIALVVTLVILGFQWLGSGTPSASVVVPGPVVFHVLGGSL